MGFKGVLNVWCNTNLKLEDMSKYSKANNPLYSGTKA